MHASLLRNCCFHEKIINCFLHTRPRLFSQHSKRSVTIQSEFSSGGYGFVYGVPLTGCDEEVFHEVQAFCTSILTPECHKLVSPEFQSTKTAGIFHLLITDSSHRNDTPTRSNMSGTVLILKVTTPDHNTRQSPGGIAGPAS